MEIIHPNCAGLDVHKKTVVACVRKQEGKKVDRETRRFATTTEGIIELFDWLSDAGCTHAVMESTGIYWRPVWRVLEGGPELVLANAKAVKNVPGRKSDVNDAQWLADLLAHGLVRGSFVPPKDQQERRELTRTRRQLIREQVQHKQRIQKVLEVCNIKLASVISDISGKSGRAILDAIAAGEIDPIKLADLARGTIKRDKWLDVAKSLQGSVSPHDRFLLSMHLRMLDSLQTEIDLIDARLEEVASSRFSDAVTRLTSIPGISDVAAETILAEVGLDMSVFPTADHLISWAGLCPRMDESAGKRRDTRVRDGAPWLKPVLVQCAWAAARTKDSYLASFFHRIRARRGEKKAVVATAAKLLRIIYALLESGDEYRDLGPELLTEQEKARQAARLLKRLDKLGYQVNLRQAA
jgi:transposase